MKFIYGEEDYLLERELKTFLKEHEGVPIVFDADSQTKDIVSELLTVSMFEDSKNIVLRDVKALTDVKEGKALAEALTSLNDSITLSIVFTSVKLDKKNPLITLLLEKADVKEVNKVSDKDFLSTLKDIIHSKGGEIESRALIMLAHKVPNNLRIAISEIDKLLLENNSITREMVEVSIGDYQIDDNYALANAISSSDKHATILSYNKLLKDNTDPTLIISKISGILNLAILVLAYKEKNIPNQQIADETKIHIFRIKKSVELVDNTSPERLKSIVIMLADLDKNIKTGTVNKDKALDSFILNLIK